MAALIGCLGCGMSAHAVDSAAGQKIFASGCAACHKLQSYAGKSDAELQTQIKGIVAGSVKHPKKLMLSADDIANVAAYISSNEPK
ncbi:MAG TPA: hypothetical protein VME42_05965 [Steroidobacteraceae bacterium]|nr:hypothetical protein [Steroidobacteraceae bacterium]